METITLTFGDCAENHRGMQEIGERAISGLDFKDLTIAKDYFESKGVVCELYRLCDHIPGTVLPEAYLLVARSACDVIVDKKQLCDEQNTLERDKKAFMYGRVVNKKARHNLCFSDFDQVADYEQGKGTVVSFAKLPLLSKIRDELPRIVGTDKVHNLQCEANYYYDIKNTYIGFHGDTERKIVVAARLGASFPLHYQWFRFGNPVGELFSVVLNDGDMYFMSEKAVGFDWKKRNEFTLRHAAGTEKKVVGWKK